MCEVRRREVGIDELCDFVGREIRGAPAGGRAEEKAIFERSCREKAIEANQFIRNEFQRHDPHSA